ncbi:MAG: acylphosphatase [Alphaproteobacteria bacterium]|nr:acylphosphatase [Alphaproteobacteria bacterium]
MTVSVRVLIQGKVQGVWYRAWTTEQATGRGLSGWVRNRLDGSVEALFHGPAEAVEAMIAACREGPPKARVDHIEQHPAEPPGEPGFRQARTE